MKSVEIGEEEKRREGRATSTLEAREDSRLPYAKQRVQGKRWREGEGYLYI